MRRPVSKVELCQYVTLNGLSEPCRYLVPDKHGIELTFDENFVYALHVLSDAETAIPLTSVAALHLARERPRIKK